MAHEYQLTEFIQRLAAVEDRFSEELRSVIECFAQSRVDLPVKKLDQIGKARKRASRELRKIDKKRSEPINLWTVCNIYSSCAVDTDKAMRDVRNSLRKLLVKSEKILERDYSIKVNGSEVTAMRRLGDDYRPASMTSTLNNSSSTTRTSSPLPPKAPGRKSRAKQLKNTIVNDLPRKLPHTAVIACGVDVAAQPEELYDKHRPTMEEQQRCLEAWNKKISSPRTEPTEDKPSTLLRPSKSMGPIERRSMREEKPAETVKRHSSMKQIDPINVQIRSTPLVQIPRTERAKPRFQAQYIVNDDENNNVVHVDVDKKVNVRQSIRELEKSIFAPEITRIPSEKSENGNLLVIKL